LRVLISGSTGLIGSALIPVLEAQGHRVTRLVRRAVQQGEDAVTWDPEGEDRTQNAIPDCDAVIHLAGESLVAKRWTAKQKDRILQSRVQGTRLLSHALALHSAPPAVFLAASAIGYYGDGGERELTESSSPGTDFLAQLVQGWEAATARASEQGIRVVNLRLGIVLSPKGGALRQLMLPFQFGCGGPLAGGRQFMSWITLSDVIGAILHALQTEILRGPVNFVVPQPIRQRDFAKSLGDILGSRSWLSVPRWALQAKLGRELADSLLLSQRVIPRKLTESGYRFADPDVNAALRRLLIRP
jgi:uncharacterized protein